MFNMIAMMGDETNPKKRIVSILDPRRELSYFGASR